MSQVPKPVNDYHQSTYGINGEYLGVSPWDKKYTLKLAYTGSQYRDEYLLYGAESVLSAGIDLHLRPRLRAVRPHGPSAEQRGERRFQHHRGRPSV